MKNMARVLTMLVMSMGVLPIPNSAAGHGTEAFEKLKSLVGHWETDKTNMNKATLDLELTSGGTAVLERFHMVENGKPVEMTTLYYLDGEQVKLTHYCMAGNQPTMKGSYAPETKTITFDLVQRALRRSWSALCVCDRCKMALIERAGAMRWALPRLLFTSI